MNVARSIWSVITFESTSQIFLRVSSKGTLVYVLEMPLLDCANSVSNSARKTWKMLHLLWNLKGYKLSNTSSSLQWNATMIEKVMGKSRYKYFKWD